MIAIKVSIEFCLSINSTFFLFNDLYQMFTQAGLESKFLSSLEPFLLQGAFKKVYIPEPIIKKVLHRYEEKGDLKTLEKVI